MTRILRVDTSSRPRGAPGAGGGSHSRALADRIVDRLTAVDPEASVTVRDLVVSPHDALDASDAIDRAFAG